MTTPPQNLLPRWSGTEGIGTQFLHDSDRIITVIPYLAADPGNPAGDDGAAITAAFRVLLAGPASPYAEQALKVRLGPWPYVLKTPITVPHLCMLEGHGPATVLQPQGCSGIVMISRTNWAPDRVNNRAGGVRDLVVDGTNAGNNAIGLDAGGGWGFRFDHLYLDNFAGTGSAGFQLRNSNPGFFTEKANATGIHLRGNTIGAHLFFDSTAHTSLEYNDLDFTVSMNDLQSGVVIDGANVTGGRLHIRGNITSNWVGPAPASQGVLVLNTFGSPSGVAAAFNGHLDFRVEDNSGANIAHASNKISFSDNNQTITGYGRIDVTGNGQVVVNGVTQTAIPAGMFQFRGPIPGNQGMPALRTVTTTTLASIGTGNSYTNNQSDLMAYLLTGTLTSLTINGISVNPAGPFFIPQNAVVVPSWSVGTPTWVFVGCL